MLVETLAELVESCELGGKKTVYGGVPIVRRVGRLAGVVEQRLIGQTLGLVVGDGEWRAFFQRGGGGIMGLRVGFRGGERSRRMPR